MNFNLFIIICLVAKQSPALNIHERRNRGHPCQLSDGRYGMCKYFGECTNAVAQLSVDSLPEICSYENLLPVVCCPNENSSYNPPSVELSSAASSSIIFSRDYSQVTSSSNKDFEPKLKVGFPCRLGNDGYGMCTHLNLCRSVESGLKDDILPDMCSFENFIPIVCCPLENIPQNESLSLTTEGTTYQFKYNSTTPVPQITQKSTDNSFAIFTYPEHTTQTSTRNRIPVTSQTQYPYITIVSGNSHDQSTRTSTERTSNSQTKFPHSTRTPENTPLHGISSEIPTTTESRFSYPTRIIGGTIETKLSTSTFKPTSSSSQAGIQSPPRISGETTNQSISIRKCFEYGKEVYSLEVLPVLLPGPPEYANISRCAISSQELIVGGTRSAPREFPHMALVGFGKADNIAWGCGGSLISERYVLTAAHCINDDGPNGLGKASWVRLGELNVRVEQEDDDVQEFRVIDRIVHPDYSPPLKYNDIALLKLDRDVEFSGYIRPACLHFDYGNPNQRAVATGWGTTKHKGQPSDDLLKVELEFVDKSRCQGKIRSKMSGKKYRSVLPSGIDDKSMVCAGSIRSNGDTCQGDSGGPLQIIRKNPYCMYGIVGVTSFGLGCGLEIPAVYTRVAHYLPWIENKVWAN